MIYYGDGQKKCEFRFAAEDILSGENFQKYAETFGAERAQGFIDATQGIKTYLEEILGDMVKDGEPHFSVYNVKTNTVLLHAYLHNFILNTPVVQKLQSNDEPAKP